MFRRNCIHTSINLNYLKYVFCKAEVEGQRKAEMTERLVSTKISNLPLRTEYFILISSEGYDTLRI